jgi:GntR family transcriptional regulator
MAKSRGPDILRGTQRFGENEKRMARAARRTKGAETAGSVRLDRESPLPLYQQIKQHLVRTIAAWPLAATQFYTDDELCEAFGVSRMTVRQAVQELVEEGLLQRRRGAGTFVVARKIEERFAPLVQEDLEWADGVRPVRIEVLAFEIQPCPPAVAGSLDLAPGTPVRYVRRVRYADGLPIALDHRFLPLDVAEKAMPQGTSRSIVHLVWEHYDLERGEMALEAATAGAEEERWLRVPAGEPVIVRRIRYVAAGDRPVMAGYTLYRADMVRYTVEIPLSRDARERAEALAKEEVYDSPTRFRREFTPRGTPVKLSPHLERYRNA